MKLKTFVGFCLFLFVSCSLANKIEISDSVFKDQKGKLFFKVVNLELQHPNNMVEGNHLFLKEVFIKDKPVALKTIVDIKSIKKIHKLGTYFVDKNYIYIYRGSTTPGYKSFIAIVKGNSNIFGQNRDFLKTNSQYFFAGIPIRHLDYNTAQYLELKLDSHARPIEFIKDKSNLYMHGRKLTLEWLCFTEFDKQIKNRIIKEYLEVKNKSTEDCKDYK